ncbi:MULTISPECIES: hypothetical protein [unclassified Streptomyces]|uniref:hypothetical protein n=1 Tax=unclassified Streptomyces TaxID=2593676 RepID=UPI00209B5A3D|nr:hypothetical protein [Streptomyces sp. YPW6]
MNRPPAGSSARWGRARGAQGVARRSTAAGAGADLPPPVIVHTAHEDGGRYVTVRGKQLGLARSVSEVIDLLCSVGIDLDVEEIATPALIEWRGGGPDRW